MKALVADAEDRVRLFRQTTMARMNFRTVRRNGFMDTLHFQH
jgi:hypothetical protein